MDIKFNTAMDKCALCIKFDDTTSDGSSENELEISRKWHQANRSSRKGRPFAEVRKNQLLCFALNDTT